MRMGTKYKIYRRYRKKDILTPVPAHPYYKTMMSLLLALKMPLPAVGKETESTILDFIPVVGNIKPEVEAVIGKDLITGRELEE
ncbi:pre-toxin TG domain-containing protein [Shouchella rhizosphaerae]|uniref:pre-toxin TG domain-containing protein n=1 Tax=Shouchella rhizosphaerae TaxID=866786 RepID=UPI003F802728